MRLVLLTTTDLRAGREDEFLRMVASVRAGADVQVRMFALLQHANEDDRSRYESILPQGSVVLAIPGRLSLSEARNRLLEAAQTCFGTGDNCVVGFPDDDCWYPPRFLHSLVSSFRLDPQLDMFASGVSITPVDGHSIGSRLPIAKARQIVRRSSSNSMFFRGRMVAALGHFDPVLGLGTPNGGGEDTDYALRALLTGRRAVFVDLPLVGHRESDLTSVVRYYRGSLMVLSRYALKRTSLCFEYLRKLAVGAYLVLRSRLPPQEYLASATSSFGELYASAHVDLRSHPSAGAPRKNGVTQDAA